MHEGHRQRMYDKLKNDDGLHDHELLEILLYNGLPRINTNLIAHELLNTFGSISGVLDADVDKLTAVKGVGESTALYLKCIGEFMKRVNLSTANIAVLRNHGEIKNFVAMRLRGKLSETIEIYCMHKNGRVKRVTAFTDDELHDVKVRADKIVEVLLVEKPFAIIAAHNHLSGDCAPSDNDRLFTAELQMLCSINNVKLLDHLIYAGDKKIYSYFLSGELEEITRDFSFKNVVSDKITKIFKNNKEN